MPVAGYVLHLYVIDQKGVCTVVPLSEVI